MFAVIYRSYLKPGCESAYKELWNKIATYFIQHRGAIGSTLHQTEDGMWVAYSRWPDKATRDASWPGESKPSDKLPESIQEAILSIQTCVDQNRKHPEICMHIVDDLLINNWISKTINPMEGY
ncbi:MAG: antibiotic biosynthesis monooxygenase [Gammaproteobacteria bacterium]